MSLSLESHAARPNWKQRVEESGLIWHGHGQDHYWSETQHVSFDLASLEILEDAANQLHEMCLRAVGEIMRRNWWSRLGIPEAVIPWIKESWMKGDFSLYGRFDLAWNGSGYPKLLEYNADTPTSLLEASIIQWDWLQDVFPESDQLNSMHEALVDRWRLVSARRIHFACVKGAVEDLQTVAYLAETAEQAGKEVILMDVSEIGFNEWGQFTDAEEQPIEKLFKLYPWEWILREEFGEELVKQHPMICEPLWKMLWSNKALLPILWELFPNHPLLLPAFDRLEALKSHGVESWVEKPMFGREGGGVKLFEKGQLAAQQVQQEEPGEMVYQQKAQLYRSGEEHFVFGMWMVGDRCTGMSIRADRSPITGNFSRFLPHRIR